MANALKVGEITVRSNCMLAIVYQHTLSFTTVAHKNYRTSASSGVSWTEQVC